MKKELFDNNPILKLSFDFALMIVEFCEKLEAGKKYIISRQLLKSGTSIGANAMEAQRRLKNHNTGYGFVNVHSRNQIMKSYKIN